MAKKGRNPESSQSLRQQAADYADDQLLKEHFHVTIFGSARIKPGDPTYRSIYNLADMIAREGMDIVTGGGPGIMDAASRGHHNGRGRRKKNDVHTVGLTIHLPKEQKESFHLDIKQEYNRFSERLDSFMHLSNIVIVAPGGVGTLLEFFYTWQLVQVGHTCPIPIVFMGGMWKGLIRWIENEPLKQGFLSKEDLDVIFHVEDEKGAMRIIRQAYAEFKRSGENFCSNLTRYTIRG